MNAFYYTVDFDSLVHHGIKGQKWGERRYQNKDGTWTAEGKARRRTASIRKDYPQLHEIFSKEGADQRNALSDRIKTHSGDYFNGYTKKDSNFEKTYASYAKSNGLTIADLENQQRWYGKESYAKKNNPDLYKAEIEARKKYYEPKKIGKALTKIAKVFNVQYYNPSGRRKSWNQEHYYNSKDSNFVKSWNKAGEDAVKNLDNEIRKAKVRNLTKKEWYEELSKAALKDLGYSTTKQNIQDIMDVVIYD